ncbi:MAG: A-macroglobulin complement component, partial [Candidatus Riflebacteria bacterium]|nr:A-macroglobulin complement component [Candidatus Riflebacteria bacterium]
LQVRYFAEKPASAPGCAVSIDTTLKSKEVAEGETVDLAVRLANRTDKPVPMTVAIVGLPAGLESRADQLKELVKSGQIDAFETRSREVILYRRGMAPKEERSIVINLVAAIPGDYTGPASRAYLYYTDELKMWAEPLGARIVAKN